MGSHFNIDKKEVTPEIIEVNPHFWKWYIEVTPPVHNI